MFKKEFLNGEITLQELFSLQSDLWSEKNRELFGLSVNKSDSTFIILNNLKNDVHDYWNFGSCRLKEHFFNDNIFKDKDKFLLQTFQMEYIPKTNVIALSGLFLLEAYKKGNKVKLTASELAQLTSNLNQLDYKARMDAIKNGEYKNYTFEPIKANLCFLPLVIPYGYKIKNSNYALRTQVAADPYLLRKYNGVVHQKGWSYQDGKFKDGVNHFKDVNPYNYPFLNAILGEQVTEENFTRALDLMPEMKPNSIIYHSFRWFEEVEQCVLHPKRKFISATKGTNINYAFLLNAPRKYSTRKMNDLCTNLILVKNKIKALEVARSVLFPPADSHNAPFNFDDSEYVFDAFKTITSKVAGRSRVLLDNMFIEDSMIKCKWKGKVYNQYEIALGKIPDELKEESNLSCLSHAPYNYLNDAKRIMFCAKLRGQAVKIDDEIDSLTHETPARVVFADFGGFSFGDSFIISQSFAKRLRRTVHKSIATTKKILHGIQVGDHVSQDFLTELEYKNTFSSWQNITVTKKLLGAFEVTAQVPFGVGDKITNMHGSKGIVSIILPDEEMPCLKYDLSPLMKKGPVDVIVPGISVYRRKSTGQLFEALTRALDIPELPLQKLYEEYKDVIKDYDEHCIFSFQGKEFKAPCGINNMIRLDHDATSKQSFSYIKSNPVFLQHFGEMELLNLASRGEYNILNEFDLRSMSKHIASFRKIRALQQDGIIKNEIANTDYLPNYFKFLGWKLQTDQPLSRDDIQSYWNDLFTIVDNKELDIF